MTTPSPAKPQPTSATHYIAWCPTCTCDRNVGVHEYTDESARDDWCVAHIAANPDHEIELHHKHHALAVP